MNKSENSPNREFVGFVWVGDQPGIRLRILAKTAAEAREKVIAEYGEGHTISLSNEEDKAKPRVSR